MDHATHHVGSSGFIAQLVLFNLLPAILLCIYLFAARKERQTASWSNWRVTSFTVGILLIIFSMSPAISEWAHSDLRGHMVQHLMLGMFAPLGLALGAPGTLLLRNVSSPVARGIVALLAVPPIRLVIHPITAAVLDIGGMYVLYLTPLYAFSLTSPTMHVLLHIHFIVSGYLFTWSIAGPDPAPHRPGMYTRLVVVFLATAAHAILGKIMFAYSYPRGTMADISEIQTAAQWMYYGGDFAELLLIVAFFAAWFQRRSASPTKLFDRRRTYVVDRAS